MKDKLIPMTDYALMQEQEEFDDYKKGYLKIIEYARFLKLPLILGMFVPCDESGNVLTEPKLISEAREDIQDFGNKLIAYEAAKEKVLFVGCTLEKVQDHYVVYYNSQSIWISWTNRVIEDLIKHEIELTESAKKTTRL